MKKFLKRIAIVLLLIILVFVTASLYFRQQQAELYAGLQTETIGRGQIAATISASGTVRSNQSAYLIWKASGEVDQVLYQVGDLVSRDDIIANLATNSLPPYVLLAQAELINAQRALDSLMLSETQHAQALKAVDEAQMALDQARNPELAQAQAQANLAEAQQALEEVEYHYEILISPPPQLAIDQAYANWVLAEQELADLSVELQAARNKATQNPDTYLPWESRDTYLRLVEALEAQQLALEIRVQQAEQKYNNLLTPPDVLDVKVAEANLQAAQAQLDSAQVEWERVQSGPSTGEIAVLEARLADAQRDWERIKDGPDPTDISSAQANIAAAQATLDSTRLQAPFDGTLTQVFAQPGDQIQAGSLAFRIDDLSQILVDLQVSEVDVNRVRAGLPVIMTFDAIPARPFHGEVVEVAMVATSFFGEVTFEVTVALSDADADVRPGMTSNIDITIQVIEEALLVPNRAVRIVNEQPVIYTLATTISNTTGDNRLLRDLFQLPNFGGSELVAIPITLGESSDLYSQVLEGELQAGDIIVLNPPFSLINQPDMSGPPPFVRR